MWKLINPVNLFRDNSTTGITPLPFMPYVLNTNTLLQPPITAWTNGAVAPEKRDEVPLIFTLFCTILIILKLIREYTGKTLALFLVFYLPFILIVIFGLIFAGIPLVISLNNGIPFGDFEPEGWEFYEWGMFFGGLYSTLGTHFIFAEEI